AAYACYFNIPCFVFVPEKTTEAKLAQATIFDANIIRIKGSFSTCERLCREFAKSGNYYLAGDFVFREEGQKSFSYELHEQGGSEVDYIFIPIGCGTNFSAIFKGYKEMKEGGLIDKIPKFVAIQPDQSSPVVDGIFKKKRLSRSRYRLWLLLLPFLIRWTFTKYWKALMNQTAWLSRLPKTKFWMH